MTSVHPRGTRQGTGPGWRRRCLVGPRGWVTVPPVPESGQAVLLCQAQAARTPLQGGRSPQAVGEAPAAPPSRQTPAQCAPFGLQWPRCGSRPPPPHQPGRLSAADHPPTAGQRQSPPYPRRVKRGRQYPAIETVRHRLQPPEPHRRPAPSTPGRRPPRTHFGIHHPWVRAWFRRVWRSRATREDPRPQRSPRPRSMSLQWPNESSSSAYHREQSFQTTAAPSPWPVNSTISHAAPAVSRSLS